MIIAEYILPGQPYPLGASWSEKGTNFAIFSKHARNITLCLFDENDQETQVEMKETHRIFHCELLHLKPGQRYGFRVDGEYKPAQGHRSNCNKLLIDPYAKAIAGDLIWNEALFGYQIGADDEDLSFSEKDSAAFVPKSIVVDDHYDWEGDKSPEIPMEQSVIYELHVKGFSKQNEHIPESLRGTYAGLAHPSSINYLKSLGITAVELMPVHHFVSDGHLIDKGLHNYWGYNSIGFFAPDFRYSSSGIAGEQVNEFKDMVKSLHRAGLEVILDVVYNHTAEGNEKGPTISFKGIDNVSYYRVEPHDMRYYTDFSGTGNTLNTQEPIVLRLIMDSLRYWVTEMHVDGFRFDLATALVRGEREVEDFAIFFNMIHQDPVLCKVKLIAEPWDIGDDGYLVGKFPVGWSEWNGKFRDVMRRFWRGDGSLATDFAKRFAGSPDLYSVNNRLPSASINFITAHDGFTLRDLVSYAEKHNEANGDHNQDGEEHNHSWNCGAEGETDLQEINIIRRKQQRNLLTTLLLSQGVPMITSGDEIGKTQHGNNNAYCQDNKLSWLNWKEQDQSMLEFTQHLIHLRKNYACFNNKGWIDVGSDHPNKLCWLHDQGYIFQQQWPDTDCFGVLLKAAKGSESESTHLHDASFLVLINTQDENISFRLSEEINKENWRIEIDTSVESDEKLSFEHGAVVLEAKSIKVFRAD